MFQLLISLIMAVSISSSDYITVVEDGKDAVFYSLVTSVDTVRFDSNNVPSPNNIVVTAYKTTGNDTPALTAEMSIRYRKIKGSAGNYVNKGHINQFLIDITAPDFDIIEITGLIGDVEIARKTISSLLDGRNGQNGKPGPLFYPYGSWNKLSNYARTETECPYVLYDTGNPETDLLYYPKEMGVIEGNSENLPPNQDDRWKVMNYFEAIQTKVLIAQFGRLGKAVFYNDYMFSQDGIEKEGAPTPSYRGFPDGTFIPNFQINLRSGELKCRNVKLEGSLKKSLKECSSATDSHVFIDDTANDWVITVDADITYAILNLGTPESLYGCDIAIYHGGIGKVAILHATEAPLLLWRGKAYTRVYLNKFGNNIKLKFSPVNNAIPSHIYGIGYIIDNEASFMEDPTNSSYLISIQ